MLKGRIAISKSMQWVVSMSWIDRLAQWFAPSRSRGAPLAYLEEVFHYFPFTTAAQTWLRENIRVEVQHLQRTSGGGYWDPGQRLVMLYTAQYEAAIHELAHAWWHDRRLALKDALVASVTRLERERALFPQIGRLADHYINGIATQPGFEKGMLLPVDSWGSGGGPRGEWNDWEMYAGLASGCMADIRLIPAYLREFYLPLFRLLPDDAPAPVLLAPHR